MCNLITFVEKLEHSCYHFFSEFHQYTVELLSIQFLVVAIQNQHMEVQKPQFLSSRRRYWLQCSVQIYPPMLKRRSLSTEDGGEHSILFVTFPSSEIMLRLVFYQLRGSTSRGLSGRQQNLSCSPIRVSVDDDLRTFLFLEVRFSTFYTGDVATNHQSKSHSRTC